MAASLVVTLHASVCAAEAAETIVRHDASSLTVEGKGWTDTAAFYDRLPARAEATVPDGVWGLSHHSAGMAVRFVSNAPRIMARWKLLNANLAMPHMPATGVSGLDLYIRHDGKWRWVGAGRPEARENECALISGLVPRDREFILYLPLYNGVTSVEIGVPEGSEIRPAPPRAVKPVVFYGTSITQGGCASRPGMAYPAIIGRKLDVPTINLGFSGNGRCEHEMADLLAEPDPSVYVIDPLPNMTEDTIEERVGYLLKTLRAKHPSTPVILVENVIYQYAYAQSDEAPRHVRSNRALARVYKAAAPEWGGRLYYVKCDKLLGSDGEGTVDGVHPTDVGFIRMADALGRVVGAAQRAGR